MSELNTLNLGFDSLDLATLVADREPQFPARELRGEVWGSALFHHTGSVSVQFHVREDDGALHSWCLDLPVTQEFVDRCAESLSKREEWEKRNPG